MKRIPLSQDKHALVDDKYYEWLMQWKWYANGRKNNLYAVRKSPMKNGKSMLIRMHREILDLPPGISADHINGDGLDNRKNNLRLATAQQNSQNRTRYWGDSSYKGVCWHKYKRKWMARIGNDNSRIHLGYFNTEEEAAFAYNQKAIEVFGEFAHINNLKETS